MSEVKWTEKQAEAIELRNKNMLVAAAAGSGKTAVLVERIKRLIIEEQVSVNEILVVTFTNAAAAEMREKIVKAVTSELEKGLGDTAFLRKQLNLIYKANISTFHAFALEVIRRFFHIIDIEPDFKICDEAQQIILQSQAMDRLFEELFESGDSDFTEFLHSYASSKNENTVKEMILETYKMIQSVPGPWSWLEDNIKALNKNQEDYLSSELFLDIKKYILTEFVGALSDYEKSIDIFEEAGACKFAGKCKEDLNNLQKAAKLFEADDFDGFGSSLGELTFARMVTTKDEKEAFDEVKELAGSYRERCKKTIKSMREDYFTQPLAEQIKELQEVYPKANTLGVLVKKFSEYYTEEKTEKKRIDFNDIEHYALEILKDVKAAEEYRQKFKYIFIDEYQDSNGIQDTLIAAIKRENNVFMVGDVKQSIYKFRLAEPELFLQKYSEFRKEENALDAKIDLNYNFRSKGNVIAAVNHIFSSLMPDYDEEAALHKGVSYDGELDYSAELHIVDQKITEDMELGEEIKELKTAEREGFIAGKIIKEALGKNIFDGKKNIERPLQKKDIVILMRGQKNYADKFRQVLTEMDIPCHINDSDGYFDTLEIQVFLNLLKVIDNRRQDIPLISVLYSTLFRFSAEELAAIRSSSNRASYFEAFADYSAGVWGRTDRQEAMEPDLSQRCKETLEQLADWKRLSLFMPLDKLIWKLLWDTGYYAFAGALPGGEQRQANLRALVDKAVQFQSSQMKGLYSFITYVDAIKEKRVPMGQVTLVGENDDVVRIMTIHKSKGLEFPMVIVAGLGKRFNNSSRGAVDLHKDIGIGLKYIDRQEHYFKKTLLQKAIGNRRKAEDMEEEVRILYVAFTRAQDKLVLLGSVKDMDKFMGNSDILEKPDLKNAGCYLDLIMPALRESEILTVRHDVEEIAFDSADGNDKKEELYRLFQSLRTDNGRISPEIDEKTYEELYAQIDRRLSFEYGYEYARKLKSKFSVSSLNKISDLLSKEGMTPERYERLYYESSYDMALAVPEFTKEKNVAFSAAERGTIIHSVLEHWNFKEGLLRCSEQDGILFVKAFIESMEKKKQLTSEEAAEAIRYAHLISDFQCSQIGKRLAEAELICKEMPFNLMEKVKGEDIIVQGIIDCYFKEGDDYILLDYKTSRVNNPEDEEERAYIRENYREQIELYRRAIEVTKGIRVKEAYLCLLNAGLTLQMD